MTDYGRHWFGDGTQRGDDNGGHRQWMPRERGGYWRQYEDQRGAFAGRVKDVTSQPPVSREANGHTAASPVSQQVGSEELQVSQPQAIPRKSTLP